LPILYPFAEVVRASKEFTIRLKAAPPPPPEIPPPEEWLKDFKQLITEAAAGQEIKSDQLATMRVCNPTDQTRWLYVRVIDKVTGRQIDRWPPVGNWLFTPHSCQTVKLPVWPKTYKMPDRDLTLKVEVVEWSIV